MSGDVSLFGVYVPALLVAAIMAGGVLLALRRVLARLGFYRFVWHRTLVDVALYVLLLGATIAVLSPGHAPTAGSVTSSSLPVGSQAAAAGTP
jgi:hypothetical protein